MVPINIPAAKLRQEGREDLIPFIQEDAGRGNLMS
jgi:hypothetical protein